MKSMHNVVISGRGGKLKEMRGSLLEKALKFHCLTESISTSALTTTTWGTAGSLLCHESSPSPSLLKMSEEDGMEYYFPYWWNHQRTDLLYSHRVLSSGAFHTENISMKPLHWFSFCLLVVSKMSLGFLFSFYLLMSPSCIFFNLDMCKL